MLCVLWDFYSVHVIDLKLNNYFFFVVADFSFAWITECANLHHAYHQPCGWHNALQCAHFYRYKNRFNFRKDQFDFDASISVLQTKWIIVIQAFNLLLTWKRFSHSLSCLLNCCECLNRNIKRTNIKMHFINIPTQKSNRCCPFVMIISWQCHAVCNGDQPIAIN